MMHLPDEQKQVIHELLGDLDASLAEVRATVNQSTDAIIQRLQLLQAKASEAVAFLEDYEAEVHEQQKREHAHDH